MAMSLRSRSSPGLKLVRHGAAGSPRPLPSAAWRGLPCLPRATRCESASTGALPAGIRSPPTCRPGLAGHDRALTVPGHVTRTTRGPWVAGTPPGGPTARRGFPLGVPLAPSLGVVSGRESRGKPLDGGVGGTSDIRRRCHLGRLGSLRPRPRRRVVLVAAAGPTRWRSSAIAKGMTAAHDASRRRGRTSETA